MTENAPFAEGTKPKIKFFPEYGVYKEEDVAIVSAPDWETAVKDVSSEQFGSSTVLLPEIITIAGKNIHDVNQYREDVEKSLHEFSEITRSQPEATFVVGSPHFTEPGKPPYNAAFVFKKGKVVNVFHKRISAGEAPYLAMDPETPAASVNGANLLICKDVFGAAMEDEPRTKQMVIQYADLSNPVEEKYAARLASIPYIDNDKDTLYAISCWGIGMWSKRKGMTQDEINNYYQGSLESTIKEVFKSHPNLRRVVMADRAPTSPAFTLESRVATKPMSLIATR